MPSAVPPGSLVSLYGLPSWPLTYWCTAGYGYVANGNTCVTSLLVGDTMCAFNSENATQYFSEGSFQRVSYSGNSYQINCTLPAPTAVSLLPTNACMQTTQ